MNELWYAYSAYHKAGVLPSVFASMPLREKAILIAFIDLDVEAKEKQQKEIERANRKRR